MSKLIYNLISPFINLFCLFLEQNLMNTIVKHELRAKTIQARTTRDQLASLQDWKNKFQSFKRWF